MINWDYFVVAAGLAVLITALVARLRGPQEVGRTSEQETTRALRKIERLEQRKHRR